LEAKVKKSAASDITMTVMHAGLGQAPGAQLDVQWSAFSATLVIGRPLVTFPSHGIPLCKSARSLNPTKARLCPVKV